MARKFLLHVTVLLFFATLAHAQLMTGGNLSVVKVGSTEFSKGKVDSLSRMLAAQQFNGQQVPPETMQKVRWAVVDNLVGQELLRLEGQKTGVKADNKMVDSLVDLFKSQYPSEAAFLSDLKKNGSSKEDFRIKVEKQVISDKILEKKVPYPKDPTESEVKVYWEAHKSEAKINDTIAGAQIFLKLDKGESAQSIADKKQILEGLAAQVRSGKASFAMLAAQYSDDPNAKKDGGVSGRFVPSEWGPEFVKAVQSVKVGDMTSVYVTKNLVGLFMVTERNDGKIESYRHKIDYILRVEKEQDRQEKIRAYLHELAKTYPVTYLNDEYKSPEAIGGK